METYAYELTIRGKPGGVFDVKGSHFILADHVNGRDFLRDATPIHVADVGPWLSEGFKGMVGQVAAAEAARDVALADRQTAEADRDRKVAAAEALVIQRDATIAALEAGLAALKASPPVAERSIHRAWLRAALAGIERLADVDAAVQAAGPIQWELWSSATTISQDDPDVRAVAAALGIDLDAVFAAARAIQAARGA